MSLLEITLVLGVGLSIVTTALVQGNAQFQALRAFKQVEYYSKDVPRMVTAVHNLSRDSHTFRLFSSPPNNTLRAPAVPPTAGAIKGNALFLYGNERTASGGFGADERGALLWMANIDGGKASVRSDRLVDSTGAIDFPLNKYNVMATAWKGKPSSGGGKDGWVLCENVADVTFDLIPGTDGAVLMRVYRQTREDAGAELAFDMVLERR